MATPGSLKICILAQVVIYSHMHSKQAPESLPEVYKHKVGTNVAKKDASFNVYL